MKPKVRYGILDGFGEIVRWTWTKPTGNYKFVTEKVISKHAVDWSNFDPAPF